MSREKKKHIIVGSATQTKMKIKNHYFWILLFNLVKISWLEVQWKYCKFAIPCGCLIRGAADSKPIQRRDVGLDAEFAVDCVADLSTPS